ncbi:class I SAM-dependent methyltransferase [Phyllobacterium sp. OV277]|uniref:class I SAM-dependent methyltransferase n=1 Tax=Phyllobacterium sp. OV277 TaxID=1882772 RepID=UPI00088CC8E0|nr:class I SAM-dependent methyltransferase [Phyllobacterium sp. OV277]SDO79284.1 Methyltransferase domain-containing protein [Phyllobacterium sp. OV277]
MSQEDAHSNEFDAYKSSYADAVNKSISFSGLNVDFFIRAKAVRLVDILRKHIGDPTELSILDVGCGVGTYHPLLRGQVGKISGIDPSAECISEAESNNPDVAYKSFDGKQIPHPDASFDAAFAICVMHHVPPSDWTYFSSELARVTRPGGLVVLFEHNPYNPLTRRAVNTCPFDADAVLLTKKTASQYLQGAGLRDVDGRYILTVPAIKGVMRKVDDAFGQLPFGAQYFVMGRV